MCSIKIIGIKCLTNDLINGYARMLISFCLDRALGKLLPLAKFLRYSAKRIIEIIARNVTDDRPNEPRVEYALVCARIERAKIV